MTKAGELKLDKKNLSNYSSLPAVLGSTVGCTARPLHKPGSRVVSRPPGGAAFGQFQTLPGPNSRLVRLGLRVTVRIRVALTALPVRDFDNKQNANQPRIIRQKVLEIDSHATAVRVVALPPVQQSVARAAALD